MNETTSRSDATATSQLLGQVRRIEIKTRKLSQDILAGRHKSAVKGRGMAFSEVREYQYGDDVRDIDWNVTARSPRGNDGALRPYVKQFEEERERTLMLLVDVSGSLAFGSRKRQKRELATEIAATLAFSAMKNDDKIGVLFFTDRIEGFIPLGKGRRHVLRIIRELLDFRPVGVNTNLDVALIHLRQMMKRRCTAFILSDFLDTHDLRKSLLICGRRHDVTAIQLYDPLLHNLPDVGLLYLQDTETGERKWVDTSAKRVRKAQQTWWQEEQDRMIAQFRKSGIDFVSIRTDEDYVRALINLFSRRAR